MYNETQTTVLKEIYNSFPKQKTVNTPKIVEVKKDNFTMYVPRGERIECITPNWLLAFKRAWGEHYLIKNIRDNHQKTVNFKIQ